MSWTALIPELVGLGVEITQAVLEHTGHDIDADTWKELGPKVEALVVKAMSGEDISHEELLKYIPDTLQMRLLQLAKKAKRIEQGLPI